MKIILLILYLTAVTANPLTPLTPGLPETETTPEIPETEATLPGVEAQTIDDSMIFLNLKDCKGPQDDGYYPIKVGSSLVNHLTLSEKNISQR